MNRALLLNFTKQDFVDKYSGSIIGVGWAFIWPLVMIAIYIVIFGRIMGARIPGVANVYGYGIYLVAGLVPWTAFTNTVTRVSTIFVDKKPVISKINISLMRLPVYVVVSETITMLITMLLFMVFLLATGFPLHKTLILFPFIYALQQLFAYALGLICGCLNVFVRDVKEFVGVAMQLWFWFTPIVYVGSILPAPILKLLHYNPMFVFVNAYHDMFLSNVHLSMPGLFKSVLLAHGLLLIAYLLFKFLERDIRDFV
ncbi:MAG TPA: ABC transporter permease [Gammaproteobacteria bacterium]|nr:ABC transporter permease [Gammaproteobacteria bacterium]